MRAHSVETNGLTALEIASHVLLGRDDAHAGDKPPAGRSAIVALERSLLRALRDPPCHLGFSGGRDSSALLAVATRVARRENLPDPIPSTLRFAGAARTQEEDWQNLVIGHLGLPEWICHEVTHELDLVGPTATAIMLRDGLPYPYNLHLLVPLIERARGGSFVTGLGGDQVLNRAGPNLDVLARRARPTRRDVLRIGATIAPRPLRRRMFRSRIGLTFPWLRPDANRQLTRAWLEQDIRWPLRWDKLVGELSRSRILRHTVRRIAGVGTSIGVTMHHPFADSEFILALAREAGPAGFASRTAAFDALFGDLLPAELISRSTKASFNEVLWTRHTRSFLDAIDEDVLQQALAVLDLDALVDPQALWAHWNGAAPLANSFLLLQACWLALSGSSAGRA